MLKVHVVKLFFFRSSGQSFDLRVFHVFSVRSVGVYVGTSSSELRCPHGYSTIHSTGHNKVLKEFIEVKISL